ncbi:MAG: nucleotidyltransferase domain-containing protein [Ignavibacteriae bacterium]|nr:nucleotidyltransferase domain-containing protein [Ignavibacteriota bacterium]
MIHDANTLVIENLIRNALSQDSRIKVALLFGSHVSGTTTPMSDIDVGIITDADLSLMDLGYLTATLESALHSTVDLIALNDLYKRRPQLAFNIVASCRVVFSRDEEVLVRFKRNTYLYFIDTKPLREMTDAALRQRIAAGKFGVKNYVG